MSKTQAPDPAHACNCPNIGACDGSCAPYIAPAPVKFDLTEARAIVVDAIRRMRAGHVACADLERSAEEFLHATHAAAKSDELWDQTLQERDRYHEVADSLAQAIAKHLGVEIGEHSSANCPWHRALEALEEAAIQAPEGDVRNALAELLDECISSYQAGTLPKSITWDRLTAAQRALAAPAPQEWRCPDTGRLCTPEDCDRVCFQAPAEGYGSTDLPYAFAAPQRQETLRLLSWITRTFGNDHPAHADVEALAAACDVQPKGMPAEWLDAFEEWRQTLGAADLDGKRDLVWRHIAGTGFQAGAAWARSQAPAPAPEPVAWVDERAIAWLQGRQKSATITTPLQAGKSFERPMALYAAPCAAVVDGNELATIKLREWAIARWRDEVENRPLVNKHRRSLDDTWRQVIRFAGGDPDEILGPSHDALLAASQPPVQGSQS